MIDAKFPHTIFRATLTPAWQTICITLPNIQTMPATAPRNKTKKVLIVEDEGEMCLLLNIILDSKKMELDHVKTIQNAIEYLELKKPSVVILDNRLPDGYGVDFIGYIKSNYPGIRIVMISGYGNAAKDLALANGADLFIEKPFRREEIRDSVNNLLRQN